MHHVYCIYEPRCKEAVKCARCRMPASGQDGLVDVGMVSEEQPMRLRIATGRCLCLECEGAGAGAGAARAVAGRGGGGGGDTLRACASEALGTTLLVLLSCLPPPEPVQRALAAGLVVAMLVQCFDHISGAMFNPVVLLASVMWGRVSAGRGAAMFGAQVAGGAAGAALLRAGGSALVEGALTVPADGLGGVCAAAIEAVLGGCLALANCASWDTRNAGLKDSWPLRIGAAVAGMSLVAGRLTGASMNPARSLGPALLTGNFTQHWVYWVGPLGGSLLSTALYRTLWHQHHPAPPAQLSIHKQPHSSA